MDSLTEHNVDTIILGCTHYPIIKDMIKNHAGDDVCLIDPGKAVANLLKSELENLKVQIRDQKPKLDDRIARLKAKIEKNTEYRKRAYEQFMDDILSKEEYLELKKMYDTENEQFEKELDELKNVEETEMTVMQDTVKWLDHFTWGKITAAQLTREVLVELIDRIYVYPDQQIEMYFKFAPGIDSTDRITQKDEVV